MPEEKKDEVPAIDPAEFAALQTSVEKLTQKNRELIQAEKDERKKAETAAADAAKKSGDVDALEASWQAKLESETKARDEALSEYQNMVKRMTVGTEAHKLASELALPGMENHQLCH